MNWDRFDTYLGWARVFIWVSVISTAGLAIAKPLGFDWLAMQLFLSALVAGLLSLALAFAIAVESADFDLPDWHL